MSYVTSITCTSLVPVCTLPAEFETHNKKKQLIDKYVKLFSGNRSLNLDLSLHLRPNCATLANIQCIGPIIPETLQMSTSTNIFMEKSVKSNVL